MPATKKYAIVKAGSKQYYVEEGEIIDVDLLDIGDNQEVEFKEVLFISEGGKTKIGAPFLESHVVKGTLLQQEFKGPKLVAYKFKRRKNSHKKIGHRQKYTRVKITDVGNVG